MAHTTIAWLLAALAAPVAQDPELAKLERLLVQLESLRAQEAGPHQISRTINRIATVQRPETVKALSNWLRRAPDQNVNALVHAVSNIRVEESSQWLRSLIEDARAERSWRLQAVNCLTHTNAEDFEWLKEQVAFERDEAVRARMLSALLRGEIEGLETEYLEAARARDSAEKAAGLRGIARLRLARGLRAAEQAMDHPSATVRRAAIEALGVLGGAQSFETLIESYDDFRNRGLRGHLAKALRGADDPGEIRVLIEDGLTSRDEGTVTAAIDAISVASHHHPEQCGPALLRVLSSGNTDARMAAIRGLVQARPPGTVEALSSRLRGSDALTRLNAAWALAEIGEVPEEARKPLLRMTRSERPSMRLHATRALRGFRDDEALAAVTRSLGDELWAVRSAAVEALVAMRRVESVPAIVRAMRLEEGRVLNEMAEGLATLTGEDFGPAALSWNDWWQDRPGDYALPPAEDARRELERKRAIRAETVHSTGYHGIVVPPGGVVFVLDVSGSMNSRYSGGRSRYEHFADALSKTLSALPASTRFNILLFETRIHAWRDELVLATAENVQKAKDFLAYNKPLGGTNLHGGLRQAMSYEGVQTVFLLSDGQPTAGSVTHTGEILADIGWFNRDRRIVVHTIAAGSAEAAFMADLAAANGGESVDLRGLRARGKQGARRK